MPLRRVWSYVVDITPLVTKPLGLPPALPACFWLELLIACSEEEAPADHEHHRAAGPAWSLFVELADNALGQPSG